MKTSYELLEEYRVAQTHVDVIRRRLLEDTEYVAACEATELAWQACVDNFGRMDTIS